jgi:hypothetical protein
VSPIDSVSERKRIYCNKSSVHDEPQDRNSTAGFVHCRSAHYVGLGEVGQLESRTMAVSNRGCSRFGVLLSHFVARGEVSLARLASWSIAATPRVSDSTEDCCEKSNGSSKKAKVVALCFSDSPQPESLKHKCTRAAQAHKRVQGSRVLPIESLSTLAHERLPSLVSAALVLCPCQRRLTKAFLERKDYD